jgi:ABC-type glycerol-3-phosphate transport system permease component
MIGAAIMIVPLLWVVSTAFKTQQEAIAFPPHFIPYAPTLDNFKRIFTESPFPLYFKNSFIVSGSVVIGALFFCSLTGYSLARYNFPGSRLFFIMVLGKIMIPSEALIVSLYRLVINLGMRDSLLALIIPTELFSAFGIFMMRQFFLEFPQSILDSATIDGCGDFSTLWRIVLPNMTHALFTLGIFLFVWSWSEFLWPLIVIDSQEKMTIQVGLERFSNQYFTEYGPKMAGVFLSILPVLAIFLIFQRQVLENVALSGLKE